MKLCQLARQSGRLLALIVRSRLSAGGMLVGLCVRGKTSNPVQLAKAPFSLQKSIWRLLTQRLFGRGPMLYA